jgi:hypothetical protein
MRKRLFIFCLLFSTFIFPVNCDAGTNSRLTERQALDVLVSRIKMDKVYDSWAPNLSCLLFLTEEKANNYFDFAIREKHGDGCPGDPNTVPIVDRFRVNRVTKSIQWYDPAEDELRPYKTMLKLRQEQSR